MSNLPVSTFCALAIVMPVVNSSEAWVPEVKFQLEDADYVRTLTWISGFGYALDAIGRMPIEQHQKLVFCTPIDGYIGSKELLEILNTKFAGQTITSEEATAEIIDKVPSRYPCK